METDSKSNSSEEYWYFTFMQRQAALKNRYVRLHGSSVETRARLMEVIGDKWAFQYTEDEFLPIIATYGLKEIALDDPLLEDANVLEFYS